MKNRVLSLSLKLVPNLPLELLLILFLTTIPIPLLEQERTQQLMINSIFLIAGLTLIICEVLLPGFFMLWLGIAALITAGVASLFDLTLQSALITYGVLSVMTAVFGYFAYQSLKYAVPIHQLNKRAHAFMGQSFVLGEPIQGGRGIIAIGDSVWALKCSHDLPEGTKIIVIGIDGNHLIVKQDV